MDNDQLREYIEVINADTLRALARGLDLPKGPKLKGQLVDAFERYFRDALPTFIEHLSPVEKQFLAEAAHSNGSVAPSVFSAKYNSPCPNLQRYMSYSEKSTPLILIARVDEYDNSFRVTDSIAEAARALLPKPPEVEVATVDEIPSSYVAPKRQWQTTENKERPIRVFTGERVALEEARRVVGLAAAGKLKVAEKSRKPTHATVRTIAGALILPDFDAEPPEEHIRPDTGPAGPIRPYAWGVLVQQCGWCKARGGKLTVTKAGKQLLQSAGPERFREGIETFILDDTFDELNRIDNIKGQSGTGKRCLSHPSERRDMITEAVTQWPANRWIAFDEAYRFIYASGNAFEVAANTWHLYFHSRQYGHLAGCSSSHLNRQYVRAFFLESMATLGLLDVAYVYPHWAWPEFRGRWGTDDFDFISRYDGLLYVKLNALGAYCLGAAETYDAPAVEAGPLLHILPNRDIVLVGEIDQAPVELAMLSQFAIKKSDRVWKIDPAHMLSYLESGGTINDVTQFLRSCANDGIPETVQTLLADIGKKASAITGVDDALLIEAEDEFTAALIAHDPRAKRYCYLAGERHLAVRKKNLRSFRTAARKLGYILPP